MTHRVAVMVDGNSVNPKHAHAIMGIGMTAGVIAIARVYGARTARTRLWIPEGFHAEEPDAEPLKIATLMAIDAVEFALTDVFDTLVIATTDKSFEPLAQRIGQYGKPVIGAGTANAPDTLREAYSEFRLL